MLTRPVTSDALARLRDERDHADRQYNEALTALDRSLPAPAPLPDVAAGLRRATGRDAQRALGDSLGRFAARSSRHSLAACAFRLAPGRTRSRAAAGLQLGPGRSPQSQRRQPARAADSALLEALERAGRRDHRVSGAPHSVPAAGHALRRHEGPARGRQPDGGLRRRDQHADRRSDAPRRVDGRARGTLRRARQRRQRDPGRPARPARDDAAGDADAEARGRTPARGRVIQPRRTA